MQQHRTKTRQPAPTPRTWRAGIKPAAFVVLALLGVGLLPAIPILLGMFLIVAVALHAWLPELQPHVRRLLRVRFTRANERRRRLFLTLGSGILLVVSGSMGATIRGQWRSQWEQHGRRNEVADEEALEHMERARGYLSSGDVGAAELSLLDAGDVVDLNNDRREEVDGLLERINRSGDADLILAILNQLSPEELDAFEQGTSVPAALEFGERALTYRAVELALGLLEEARQTRARR